MVWINLFCIGLTIYPSICMSLWISISVFCVNLSSQTYVNVTAILKNATSILYNTSIQCHWLSNVTNWEWKEYARGVSPRSAPLDLSAEAGKCSPEEVTGLSHAAYWHFLDVKELFVYSSKHNCCWQLFHPQPCERSAVCKGVGRYLLGPGRLGFRVQQGAVRRHWVSMQRGNCERQIHWHECMRAASDHVQRYCFLPGVVLHLWVMGSYPGRQQQPLWRVWSWDGAASALCLCVKFII